VMLKCLPFVVLCKQFGQRKTYWWWSIWW
jgi:hypothetical protein